MDSETAPGIGASSVGMPVVRTLQLVSYTTDREAVYVAGNAVIRLAKKHQESVVGYCAARKQ